MLYSEFLKLTRFNYTAFAQKGHYKSKSSYQHHRNKLFSELFFSHQHTILVNATKLHRLKLMNDRTDIENLEDIFIRVTKETKRMVYDKTIDYKHYITTLHTNYLLYIAEYRSTVE